MPTLPKNKMLKGQIKIEEIIGTCCLSCKYLEWYLEDNKGNKSYICMKLQNISQKNLEKDYCEQYAHRKSYKVKMD